MHSTVRHRTGANDHKVADVRALFPAYRAALTSVMTGMVRDTRRGEPVPSWPSMKPSDVGTPLSSRHFKSVWNMAYAARESWLERIKDDVRTHITGSALDETTRTVLYRVNARKAWWAKSLSLDWEVTSDGELVVPDPGSTASKKAAQLNVVTLPVADEHLALLRHIAKHVTGTTARQPNLARVRTINLDSPVAPVHLRTGKYRHWVRVSTLRSGKPSWVPLVNNPYLTKTLGRPNAKLAGAVQLHETTTGVDVSLVVASAAAPGA